MEKESNLAFIDGQNLHLGTAENGWKIDHKKFRIYLKDKYHIEEAYYFLDMYQRSSKASTQSAKSGFHYKIGRT